jgi:membrane protein DedA with SNARE-associated domain
MHQHLVEFVDRVGQWGYLVIFLVVTIECAAVFFLPGETLVLIGGFFAARGRLNIGELIAVVAVGAILGYSIGFVLGRQFGRTRLLHYGRWIGLSAKHFKRVDAFFNKYGGSAIFFGRFTSFMRAFVSLAAGTSGMRFPRFLFFNIAGGIVWSVVFSLIGYFVGAAWPLAEHWIARTTLIFLVILFVVGGLLWSRRGKG